MRIALATCAGVPPEFDDDRRLGDALRARGVAVEIIRWDDADAGWERFDLVVIRSTWDYTWRREEFLSWAQARGGRLRNRLPLVRWNSDKHYLTDLASWGLPVVRTEFVAPGEPVGDLRGEVVVKPAVSAGGRDTGRFRPGTHAEARRLIASIGAKGLVAMVQPYLSAVDREGERALVFIAGELTHVLFKRAVLAPDEVATVRDDAIRAAEAMYDPELVSAGAAAIDEQMLGRAVMRRLAARFGSTPLVVRVDTTRDEEGDPVVLEVEAIEPSLYLRHAPVRVPEIFAAAIITEVAG